MIDVINLHKAATAYKKKGDYDNAIKCLDIRNRGMIIEDICLEGVGDFNPDRLAKNYNKRKSKSKFYWQGAEIFTWQLCNKKYLG